MKPLEEMGQFATVVVDPPWPVTPRQNIPQEVDPRGYKSGFWNPMPYETLSLDAIAEVPIGSILQSDAMVFCWTTRRFLPDSFNILASWELRYRFTMVWHKSEAPQMPGTPKFNADFIIVGAKGQPRFRETKNFRVANFWNNDGQRMAHSEKPEGFYDLLRRVTPEPSLDIFGRRRIAGFASWGNEAPEGPALPDHYQQVLHE